MLGEKSKHFSKIWQICQFYFTKTKTWLLIALQVQLQGQHNDKLHSKLEAVDATVVFVIIMTKTTVATMTLIAL